MIAGMSYYQICLYFLLYSFLGWVVEVIYHAVHLGKIVNRGFLCGPVCPVYGFGMLAVLAAGNGVSDLMASRPGFGAGDVTKMSTPALFILGVILTTLIELIAGWLLYHFFHARWWDYSDKPLNFHGYICPEFSLLWGMGVVLVVRGLHHDMAEKMAVALPEKYGWPIMAALYLIYLIDFIVTVLTVRGINRKLTELDAIRKKMREPSDALSTFVGENSLETTQRIQMAKVQGALGRAELRDEYEARKDEYEARKRKLQLRASALYEDLRGHRHLGSGRLLRAFPSLKSRDFDEILEELRHPERRAG